MTLALEIFRSVPKYLAAKAVAGRAPGLLAGPVAPLRLVQLQDRDLPAENWVRVRTLLSGICGSDLNTIGGGASFYFSSLVSMPFVPGHEVVGELLEDVDDLRAGQRVVLDPVLHCAVRGVSPVCSPCKSGESGLCERVTGGHVSAGLQTGYCEDTGGGWSESFVAHRSQLHPIPDAMTLQDAVLVEPLACALRSVHRAQVGEGDTVAVVGAGTVGLLTVIALMQEKPSARVIVVAKHPHQAALALDFGASQVVKPTDALGAIRRATGAFRADPERNSPFLLGGVDVAFECTGSPSGLDSALRITKGQGTVVLSGMPSGADLSPAWFRELEVKGAYTGSGSFEKAIPLASSAAVGKLISAAYPLENWRQAVDHAFGAGRLGATKIVFDPGLAA